MTEIEVFKSARTLAIKAQVPSRQEGSFKSWVRKSRGMEQYTRQFIFTETDHQNLEAASSQQSTSCGRPRAQVTSGHSLVKFKAAPKPKLISIGFRQRVWKSIAAKDFTKMDCEFVSNSKHFTKILRHTGCHESDGALRWYHVLTIMPNAEPKKSGMMH